MIPTAHTRPTCIVSASSYSCTFSVLSAYRISHCSNESKNFCCNVQQFPAVYRYVTVLQTVSVNFQANANTFFVGWTEQCGSSYLHPHSYVLGLFNEIVCNNILVSIISLWLLLFPVFHCAVSFRPLRTAYSGLLLRPISHCQFWCVSCKQFFIENLIEARKNSKHIHTKEPTEKEKNKKLRLSERYFCVSFIILSVLDSFISGG